MRESMLQTLKSQRCSPAPAALKRQVFYFFYGKACFLLDTECAVAFDGNPV